MARRRGTSRVTRPGTPPVGERPPAVGPATLPSIRQRRPYLFWGLMLALIGLLLPLLLTIVQALG